MQAETLIAQVMPCRYRPTGKVALSRLRAMHPSGSGSAAQQKNNKNQSLRIAVRCRRRRVHGNSAPLRCMELLHPMPAPPGGRFELPLDTGRSVKTTAGGRPFPGPQIRRHSERHGAPYARSGDVAADIACSDRGRLLDLNSGKHACARLRPLGSRSLVPTSESGSDSRPSQFATQPAVIDLWSWLVSPPVHGNLPAHSARESAPHKPVTHESHRKQCSGHLGAPAVRYGRGHRSRACSARS